ncbi:MAG: paraquat-inducible protein A, partial [Bacteroidetes bacterium]|nr:paraquat-inducible protein A [Bacteroidota bacterium]
SALEERAKILDYSDRLLNLQEWLTEVEYQKKKEKTALLEIEAKKHQSIANENAIVFLIVSVLYAIILLFMYGKKHRIFALFLSVTFIGISFLLQGIFNPMMQLEAYKTDFTVKAKITPINTPEYDRGKELLDSMDQSVTNKIDSILDSVNKGVEYLDGKIISLKDNLNSSAELVKNIPMVGETSAEKLKSLSSALPVAKPMLFPYLSVVREQMVSIKKIFRDSLVAMSDRYASETYGINKVFPEKTYFYFQQKSVVDVIINLWREDNYVVAVALALFSIIIPLIKLLISLFLLLIKKVERYFPQKLLTGISKWSMADVFVASSFLTYMSFSNLQVGVEIEASVCIGLYFFLAYAVLSILLSLLLKKAIAHRDKIWNSSVSN